MSDTYEEVRALMERIRQKSSPGGAWAPIHDRVEYERQMSALPPEERELALEVTAHADMCRFFSEMNWHVLPHLVREVREVRSLPMPERAARMREINHELMEYLEYLHS